MDSCLQRLPRIWSCLLLGTLTLARAGLAARSLRKSGTVSAFSLDDSNLRNSSWTWSNQTRGNASWGWATDTMVPPRRNRDGPPRVYFLFLARVGLEHTMHWQAFFNGADPEKYRALIHCTEQVTCQLNLQHSNPLRLLQIQTVPTIYCEDLMTAMVSLLVNALNQDPGRKNAHRDKFVFMSESTLPVKPFWKVHSTLIAHETSDFCFGDRDDWPSLHDPHGTLAHPATLIKHSQWTVLSRPHARQVANNWPEILSHKSFAWNIPVLSSRDDGILAIGQLYSKICTDEWAVFASIFGGLENPHFVGVTGLSTGNFVPYAKGWHGNCRTFSYWHMDDANAETTRLVEAFLADQQSGMFCNGTSLNSASPDCLSSHPAAISHVSANVATLFRRSSFLFARKFARTAIPYQLYKDVVLAA